MWAIFKAALYEAIKDYICCNPFLMYILVASLFFKELLISFIHGLRWVSIATPGLSLVVRGKGCSLVAVGGLHTGAGSVAVAHRLNCSIACGVFPDQGLNWCPLSPAGRFLISEPPGKPLKNFFFFLAAWQVGSSFPNQGLNLQPLHWKCSILTTGPPGKYRFHISFCHKNAGPNGQVCLYTCPIIP